MENAGKLQKLRMANIIYLSKIFLITIPMCIGGMLWYTVTLRPSLGLWSVGMTCMNAYYKNVCLFNEGEVMHLYNKEEELTHSMNNYLEHEERNQSE
tara:strand:+ start:158 stop:448 length:291 start_codon:yes stop_codon:yes gene_type:complete